MEHFRSAALILSWAPVEEADSLARLKASLRPGGYIIFEHVVQRPENPFPPGVHALAPGALRELFQDFEILVYREQDHSGDWGGPPTPHVWMVARKRGAPGSAGSETIGSVRSSFMERSPKRCAKRRFF